MNRKGIVLILVVTLFAFIAQGISAAAQDKIYWTDGSWEGKIRRANLDGSGIEDLITGLTWPSDLALDVSGGKMYWIVEDYVGFWQSKIQRANLDGSGIEDLVTFRGSLAPESLALDVSGGKMYWIYFDKIQGANLDGTFVYDLFTPGWGFPADLALDVSGGQMYWIGQTEWSGKIQRASLRGWGAQDLVTELKVPRDLALDVSGGQMYWTDHGTGGHGTGKIQGANLDGTSVQDFVTTGLKFPSDLVLDVSGGKMYWTDSGKIQRANLDGSGIEDLVTGLESLDGLAIALDVPVVSPPPTEPTEGKMYWIEQGSDKVRSANLDGTNVQDLVTKGLYNPYGIALDVSGSKMYWTDWETDKIQRANLSGTNVETLLSGLTNPNGIALDVSGGKMYWADSATDKIQRANLNGTNVETLVLGLGNPTGITLDVSGGKMYWTDWETDKIQRANLNGTNVETLVLGLGNPTGITLDVSGGKMYWTDWETDKIQRANLNGTNVETLVSGLGDPIGITLDMSGGKMYWVEYSAHRIQRANLNGTNVEMLVSGLNYPIGIALDVSGVTPPSTDGDVTSVPLTDTTNLHLTEHTGDVRCVAYSPWGVVLASGGTDDMMRLWRTSTGQPLSTYKHEGDVNSIAFSPNDTYIASGSDAGKLRLYKWNTAADTWVESQVFNIPGNPLANNVKSVAFSLDNTMLACGTSGNSVRIYDYDSDLDEWVYRETFQGHRGSVNSVAFSPHGVVLASASDDDTVQLWRARTGQRLATLDRHTADVNSVAFSRDDAFIATGSDDDTVILWKWSVEADTWVHHRTLEEPDADVRSVTFNPSGTVLLGGCADNTVQVWDGKTGDYHAFLQEHSGAVNSVAFNFQGTAIASGSDDGTVRQFAYTELADITHRGIDLTVPSDLISQIAFGPNSTYFVLNAQYPILTSDSGDFSYGKCIITLDLPDVPDNTLRAIAWQTLLERFVQAVDEIDRTIPLFQFLDRLGINPFDFIADVLSVSFLTNTRKYFMFPLETMQQTRDKIQEEAIRSQNITLIAAAVGSVPLLGDVGGVVISLGAIELQRLFALIELVQSTMDPKIHLNPGIGGIANAIIGGGNILDVVIDFFDHDKRPDDRLRYLVYIPKQIEEIGIKIEQKYSFKGKTRELTYKGTWNLADSTLTGTLAAPNAQPMSLSKYPPFQQLSPEVQEYLLRQLGEFVNTEAWQIPEETSLLPNYPNPFNPETWIPYQLAKPADVKLTIYDINGHVVRALDLGHQRAGIYRSRSRAAHWDGRNAQGEPVASGVYF
ncbi:MAG: SMP-30/gluconolactonase/LRE family protein, partial [Candidatus Poribacteria bacterium]|nr:SMP-30/gluconolactonase/LRE family protein [Candidatus Poribacteria bacterium]